MNIFRVRDWKMKKVENGVWKMPIFFVIGCLPFITKFIAYDSGISEFFWYPANGFMIDFYVYYKSRYFQFLILCMFFIFPFYLINHKWRRMEKRVIFQILGYMCMIVLSTVFSENIRISMVGMMDRFENVFVLLGYLLIFVYTFQITRDEKTFQWFVWLLAGIIIIMSVIGVWQLYNGGLLSSDILQKMVMSGENFKIYDGKLGSSINTGALSLTLDNPNYAGVYMSMLLSFFLGIILYTKRKILFFVFVLAVFLLICTYSRTGILAFFGTVVIWVMLSFYRDKNEDNKRHVFLFVAVSFAVLFFLAENLNGYKVTGKIIRSFGLYDVKEDKAKLQEILTLPEGISVLYGGERWLVTLNVKGEIVVAGNQYNKFMTIKPMPLEKTGFCLMIDKTEWNFVKNGGEYWYTNAFGKQEKLTKVNRVDLHGFESFASNRGYIWSRSLPLLKDTFFLGTGVETFPIVFPQNDRVGKYHYCKEVYTVIEKPHNLYLSVGIQTSVLSLLFFIGLFLGYAKSSADTLRNNKSKDFRYYFILSCFLLCCNYMICGLFVDSALQTSPLFWVSMALGFSANKN